MPDRTVIIRLLVETDDADANVKGLAKNTRDVGAAGEESSDKLEGLKKAAAAVGGAAILKTGVDLNSLKQNAQAAFTTLSKSPKAAKAELDSLQRQFGANPFGFENIVKAGQRLTAMGVPLGDLNKMLGNISDSVAAVGGDEEVFDRISMSIGQMLSKGSVQSEELLQLAEAGIPAWQLLAKEIGVSVPQAMKMVEKRQVSAKTGVDALMKGIEDRFGGATKNAEGTWSGMLARVKSETAQAAGEIVEPLMRIGTEGAEFARPVLSGVGELGNAFSSLPAPIQNTALTLGAAALFSTRLNSAWSGTKTRANEVGSSVRGIGASVRAVRLESFVATAGTADRQISRIGATAQVVGTRAAGMGRNLLGAIGGPFGLALTGAALGLSLYQAKQQEAAQAAAEHAANVEALTRDLDLQTLALSSNGRAAVSASLAKDKIGDDKTVTDTLADSKVNPYRYRDALIRGNKSSSFAAAQGELRQLSVEALKGSDVWKEYGQQLQAAGYSIDDVAAIALRGGKKLEQIGVDFSNGSDSQAARQQAAVNKLQGALGSLPELYGYLTDKTGVLAEAQKQQADTMQGSLPDAAAASGASLDELRTRFDAWRRDVVSGKANVDTLEQALAGGNITAAQAATIYGVLSGSANAAGNSAATMAANFALARKAISQSAGGFINVTGAWDSAVQVNQAGAKEAAKANKPAKPKPLPKIDDDPRVRNARDALDAFEKVEKQRKRADEDRIRAAKKVADADREAADAARDRAQAMREAASAAKQAADDAEDALKKAQDQKERADRNARDAAALAAAVRDQAGRAGAGDQAAYGKALSSAQAAASSTARERYASNVDLGKKQQDFSKKDSSAKRLERQAKDAEAAADRLKKISEAQAKTVDRIQDAIDARQYQSERVRDRLTERREKAEKSFNKRLDKLQKERDRQTEASNSKVSSSYGTMAKNTSASLGDYLKQLREQVTAQKNWKDDLLELAAKVPPGITTELAKLGPQAAPLISKLNDGTRGQLDEFVRLFRNSGKSASDRLSQQLTDATPLIEAVAQTLGSKAAAKLARAISDGKTSVEDAMRGLQGKLDNKTMKILLGIKDPKKLQDALTALLSKVKVRYRLVTKMVGGEKITVSQAYARGGWVRGGSGHRDDVHIPMTNNRNGIVGMGGEFMVRKDIAQGNKPFFDAMDRTGRMPSMPRQVVTPVINLATPAPSRQVINYITLQTDGLTARDIVREMDRHADVGVGS